jgi:hypothetical protein
MKTGFRQFAALCAFTALWICAGAHAASVRAWLDRNTMQLGETVTLNVEVSGDTTAAQPDLSALVPDFDLLGTQSSTSVNIVNGQTSSKLLWAVGLQPKREGTLTIPALTVAGQQTQPLALTVQPATAGGGKAGDAIYVEVVLDPHAPYVQQQARLSVKLYYAVNLLDGNLADPQGEGLVVRKLGQDSSYGASVGGRAYRVVERHYAVTPEKSGTLTLPALVFRGHVADGNAMDLFFNRGREVTVRSQPLTLDVRARPAASGNDAWLPARSLSLTATGVDAATAVRAGEPLTLTLRVDAQGLGFEQLPELKLPAIDGVDIYPDKPTTQNRDDGEWLHGERERKFAIVPSRAGKLTLPAISLAWWDTVHDRTETATVPALTLDVQPAAVTGVPAPAVAPAMAANATTPALPTTPIGAVASDDAGDARWWRIMALASIGLWVVTLLSFGIFLGRRHSRPASASAIADDASVAAVRAAFRAACAREDLSAVSRALLGWARLTRPDLRNLGELIPLLAEPAQATTIAELQRARYSAGSSPRSAAELAQAFAQGPKFIRTAASTDAVNALPDLYPFRT